MELSVFLAKLFGVYLLVVGLLWVARGEVISEVIEEFFANRAMLFLSGLLALVIGIAMAIGHSVWEPNWRGVITLFGYGAIVKGVARIAFPELPRRALASVMKGRGRWAWIAAMLLLGGWLAWEGFRA